MDIDKISLIALIFLNIFLSVKFLLARVSWSGKTLSILLGHLAISGVWLSESLLFLNKINLEVFESLVCFFVGWSVGTLTMQISLLSIQSMTKKKMTTLWKTPVVVGLAATILETEYIAFLFVGFLAICLYIVYQNRPRLRYLAPKLAWISVSTPFFFLIRFNELWILNLGLLIFVATTNVFHNLVFASNLLSVHED